MCDLNKSNNFEFKILMPVYNVKDYICFSIESVMKQTFQKFELIIVDDGSTDGSGELCDRYSEKEERIVVIHKENGGLLSARQAGLKAALSRTADLDNTYIMYLDSDDWYMPNTLETVVEEINHSDCDCLIYGYQIVKDGDIIYKSCDETITEVYTDKRTAYRKLLFDSSYNALWRKVVRSKVYRLLDYSQYYHISMGEDLIQSLEIMRGAKTFLFISNKLYGYRVNGNSITHTLSPMKYDFDCTVMRMVMKFISEEKCLNENDLTDYYKHCLKEVYSDIVKITRSGFNISDKVNFIDRIMSSEFYTTYLKQFEKENIFSTKGKIVWSLIRKGYYRQAVWLLGK
jgi:glycosyltransferase involved in cell wall biosynthesis